nr:PREDICTED: uncharacterized protein LOC105674914 [Linepithema humile]XP_012227026.1 PREDICTED: uncharacterized protein LOC105674914 [Linepithema humile]
MKATGSATCFSAALLLIAVFGTTIARSDPEPMARPTRPKEIVSPEQLKTYLNRVFSYSQSAMGRYGKRGDIAPMSELGSTWETLRMILDAQWRNEQRKQEKMRQNKEQVLCRNFQSADADKHTSHVAIRPGSFPDVIGKYYDDVQ